MSWFRHRPPKHPPHRPDPSPTPTDKKEPNPK